MPGRRLAALVGDVVADARLAPFGRHPIVGDASGDDAPFSGDLAREKTRMIAGLNVGTTAHLRPDLVTDALEAVTTLVARGILVEPPPTIKPPARAAEVHRLIEERQAPAKTLLDLRRRS